MVGPQLLFVLGLGRSGTTALTHIVSAHPRIAVGMERYKRLYLHREPGLRPDLFDRDRFFDFSDGLTNITPGSEPRWAAYYRQLESKWDSVDYVGDKLTAIRAQLIWEAFPTARILCIVREIEQVAASWDARARDPDDTGWQARADSRVAVKQWNKALGRIRRAVKQRPQHAAVVEYGPMFGDPAGAAVDRMFGWLGLGPTPETRAQFERTHARYVESVAGKNRALTPEDAAHLAENADLRAFHQVQRLAL